MQVLSYIHWPLLLCPGTMGAWNRMTWNYFLALQYLEWLAHVAEFA